MAFATTHRTIGRACLPVIAAFAFAFACVDVSSELAGEQPGTDEPLAKTAQFVYKPQPPRKLTVYYPDDWRATDKRPALIIFRCNIPVQREYFRKLVMVVIKPQLADVNSGRLPSMSLYEISKQPRPRNQVEDTKSAIRFVRAHRRFPSSGRLATNHFFLSILEK